VAPGALSLSVTGSPQVAASLAGYGKVICIFGAHGGVGKTMVAVHLAVGLTQFKQARVALVDGDLWMGDTIVNLNVTANRTILDATVNGVPNDPEVWTRVLVDHPSGLKVLAAPVHLEDVERVPEGALSAAAQGLRRYFDFVIVDLDDTPTESTLSVLELADQVLVVMTPELAVVRNTMRLLTTSSDIGLKERVRIVLNRADSGLEPKQVESIIPGPVAGHIPSDGNLFVSAANQGLTVFDLEKAGRAPARRALEALVTDVAEYGRPKTVRPQRSGGVLNGLIGGRGAAAKR
jgi:pilus assembly protein CpaE